MSSICDNLFKWNVENLNIASESKFVSLPQVHHMDHLTKGKNANIWEYVIEHVRARSQVEKIKQVLRKKHMMDSLDKVLVNPTNVDLEVATNKNSNSDSKRLYLEQTLSDAKSRILERESELILIEHDILKLREMYEVLDTFQDQCVDKCLQSKKFHQKLVYLLNELKQFKKIEPGNLLIEKEKYDNSFEKSLNSQDIRERIKMILKSSLVDNSSILFDVETLRKEVRQVVSIDNLIDIFPSIRAEMQKHENFEKFCNQSYENSKHNESMQLIKEMKIVHIQESFETNIISKKIKTLLKKKENFSLSTYTNSGLSCLGSLSYSSQSELFKKLSEIKGIAIGIKYLKATIKVQENEANELFIQNASLKKEYREIQTVLSDTYRMFDSIHWLLLECSKSFDLAFSQIDNASTFAQIVFSSIPIFKKKIEEVEKSFRSDRQVMWAYCIKAKLLQLIFEEIYMHCTISNVSFSQALGVDSLTSIDGIVDQCLTLNGIKNQETGSSHIFTDKYKDRTVMECCLTRDLFLSKLQHYIDEMKSEVEKSKQSVKESKVSCDEIPTVIKDWWNQDAQYISKIEAGGMSLETWLNIIKVLPESQLQSTNINFGNI